MQFTSDNFYHIYNRGNDKQLIFLQERNYDYFLNKLKTEIRPLCSIIAYCLMPNHYHLLVYISDNDEALNVIQNQSLLARKIGTMQSSYSQGINKQEKRTGSLFQQKSKAKILETTNYARTCLHYIHQNPIRAGIVKKMEDWKYSSFNVYLHNDESICNLKLTRELIDLTSDTERFYKESYEMIQENLLQRII